MLACAVFLMAATLVGEAAAQAPARAVRHEVSLQAAPGFTGRLQYRGDLPWSRARAILIRAIRRAPRRYGRRLGTPRMFTHLELDARVTVAELDGALHVDIVQGNGNVMYRVDIRRGTISGVSVATVDSWD